MIVNDVRELPKLNVLLRLSKRVCVCECVCVYMGVSRWMCVCVCVRVCVCACMRVWECMHLYGCVHVGVCMQTFKRKTFRDLTSLQSLDSWPHSHGQRFQKKRNVFLISLYNQTTYPPLQIIDVVFFWRGGIAVQQQSLSVCHTKEVALVLTFISSRTPLSHSLIASETHQDYPL